MSPMADNAQAIKDVVSILIGKLGEQDGCDKTQLVSRWPKIVGIQAAKHSHPVSLRKAQLTVVVDSSGWLYELSSSKRDIVKKLGALCAGAHIKDVRFRIGTIS